MVKFLPLQLNLQLFAGDDDGFISFDDDNEESVGPIEDFFTDDDDDDGDDTVDNSEESEESEVEPDSEEPDDEPEQQQQEVVQNQDDQKPVQSPEENARFAEQRRQRQLQQMLENMPEYQLAKQLSDLYGLTPEQLLEKVKEEQIRKQAKEQNVPIEFLREQQRIKEENMRTHQELMELKVKLWKSEMDRQSADIKKQYPVLSDEDIQQARLYILETLRNPDIPLEQAVFALHGKKIAESIKNLSKQDALAEVSGRKRNSVVNTPTGKSNKAVVLTDEERYFAKQFGMTEEEYAKYKV